MTDSPTPPTPSDPTNPPSPPAGQSGGPTSAGSPAETPRPAAPSGTSWASSRPYGMRSVPGPHVPASLLPTPNPAGVGGPGQQGGSRFVPRTPQPTVNPRKVRGGVKLSSKIGPVSPAWAAQRWLRLLEEFAPNDNVAEGIEYARLGQTKMLMLPQPPGTGGPAAMGGVSPPGSISARVQGRLPGAYTIEIRVPIFTFDQWEKVIETMIAEAKHVAGLLAGEVPAAIEDVFRPHGLKLFPQEPSDVSVSCTCRKMNAAIPPMGGALGSVPRDPGPETPFCKHVCCVMAIIAERLGQDPFLVFGLRGLWKEDLLERLRQKRALAQSRALATGPGASDRSIVAFTPRIAGVSDVASVGLEESLEGFWSGRGDLQNLDLRLGPPEVTHPLLRRLGQSPFQNAKFPLVGLLATCYDMISERALKGPTAAPVDEA